MSTLSSQNVNNADIKANGNVIFGNGNTVINLEEAAIYKDLKAQLEELNNQRETTKARIDKYPDDEGFKAELFQVDEKRSNIQQRIESLKKEILKLVEDFNKIPLNTERLRSAKSYFEAGEFEKARAILDVETITSELNALLEEKEDLRQKSTSNEQHLQDKANEFLILAHLTATDYKLPDRFEKTKEYYKVSISAERNNNNIFDFAYFLQEHNELEEAYPLYKEALQICRELAHSDPETYLPKTGYILNNFGNLLVKNNKPVEAEATYKEALELREELVVQYGKVHLAPVADTLNCLGNFLEENKRFDEAGDAYNRSLEISRNLARTDPEGFLPKVAETLNGLGILLASKKMFREAEKAYREALKINNDFVSTDFLLYLPKIAGTLNNLGNLLSADVKKSGNSIIANKKLRETDKVFSLALKTSQDLVGYNRQAFLPHVALVLYNQSQLFISDRKFDKAEEASTTSLEIYRELAKHSPQTFLPMLGRIAINLSAFYLQIKPNRKQSLDLAQEATQAALPFMKSLSNSQYIIDQVKQIVRYWSIEPEEFIIKCQIINNERSY